MNRKKVAILAALLILTAVLRLLLKKPRPDGRQSVSLSSSLAAPETLVKRSVSSQTYTNEKLQEMLQEETEKMGIKAINPARQSSGDSFLGPRLGEPGTRRQAEAAIRELGAMRQAIDAGRGKPKLVSIPGRVPALLTENNQSSGTAISEQNTPSVR